MTAPRRRHTQSAPPLHCRLQRGESGDGFTWRVGSGLGSMGSSHARAYHEIDGFHVTGVVSRGAASRTALAAELGGRPTTRSSRASRPAASR